MGKHVKVLTDNCTAMADINHMGTSSCPNRNALAKEIWLWWSSHNIWLTASHIPGVSNVEADRQSRMSQSQLEWTLNPKIFQESIHKLGVNPTIDFFASRINFQLQPIALIQGLLRLAHFTCLGNVTFFMPSLHFALSLGCYRKFNKKSQQVSLWFPSGPTQIWWPELMRMLVSSPILLPKTKNTLYLPNSPETVHPLYPKLELILCHLSGDSFHSKDFRKQLRKSSEGHGAVGQLNSIELIFKNGPYSAVEGTLIPFIHLSKKE